MANEKISALSELTSLAADDEFVVVDKSDTAMASTGTNKRVKYSTLSGVWLEDGTAAGGDLAGTLPNPTVAKLRGKNVPAPGASEDQKGFVYDHGTGAMVWTDLATQAELNTHATLTGAGSHIPSGGVTSAMIADGTVAVGDLAFDPATQAELDTHTGLTYGAHNYWASGTHSARPAAGNTGRRYYETDTGVLYYDTGAAWQAATVGQVLKAADETVNNSAVLQDDDHLKFPIEVNEVWFVEALLLLNAASATADWKFGFTGPTGATADWGAQAATVVTGRIFVAPDASTSPSNTRTIAQSVAFGGAAGNNAQMLLGWFTADATHPGTIQLQWAQNTQTAEDNKVLKNSLLRLRRLA